MFTLIRLGLWGPKHIPMAKDSHGLAGGFDAENTGGALSGLLAEEDEFDRRTLWRLGSWAVASVGAVILAILANQSSVGIRREQIASADLARQSQQMQSVARENQNEARRLASAIETLNGDRDRLYSRLAILEQGFESVTGTVARQNSASTPSQTATSPTAASVVSVGPAPSPTASTGSTSHPYHRRPLRRQRHLKRCHQRKSRPRHPLLQSQPPQPRSRQHPPKPVRNRRQPLLALNPGRPQRRRSRR